MTKVAVVTGASAGVGRATVEEFARQGYDVALLAREPDRLNRVAAELENRYGIRALAIPTDVADADAIEKAATRTEEELGPIDVWVFVRIVVGLRGSVKMRSTLRLRFDYGALPPWSTTEGNSMVGKVGPDLVVLRAPMPLEVKSHVIETEFDVQEESRLAFVLSYGPSHQLPPAAIDAEAALVATQKFWRNWIDRFDNSKTDWPQQVRRSLLTLEALIHQPSGTDRGANDVVARSTGRQELSRQASRRQFSASADSSGHGQYRFESLRSDT